VITTLSRGRAENQLAALIELQRAAGHEVAAAYLKLEGYWRGQLKALGVRVIDLKAGSNVNPAAAWRLRREIRVFSPDLVHAHMQPAELCARLALLGTKTSAPALVITKHNHKPFTRLPGAASLARWVARRAAGIIVVSDSMRAGCSFAAMKIATIRNAVDAPRFEAVDREAVAATRAQWGATDGDYILGTVARLFPVKAIDVLIRGFAEYFPAARTGAKLVVVGTGPLEAELKGLAVRLGIGERVVFAGFREDMPAVLNAFDVFTLASDSEGCPMALLEAMAAGRPVLATAVGGVPELVVDGVTGLLVPARSPIALAKAIAALEDDALRARLGAAGRERALERHGRGELLRRMMSFYEDCLR